MSSDPPVTQPSRTTSWTNQQRAEWIADLENRLAVCARIAKKKKATDRDKLAAVQTAHRMLMDVAKIDLERLQLWFEVEVQKLIDKGASRQRALAAMEEALECMDPSTRQRILTTATLKSP